MLPLVIDDALHLIGVGAYLPASRTLIVADLQLGQEGQLRAAGHGILDRDAEAMRVLLLDMLEATQAKTVVINGDLKHAFGRILPQEREDIHRIVGALQMKANVILVKGNHDTLTKPIAEELGLTLVDSWTDGDTLVLHGHKAPEDDPAFKNAKTVIIGHLHPAVTLSDGVRAERVKCFLLGAHQKKRLVILPSCTTLAAGADVLRITPKGPFFDQKTLDASTIYLTDERGVQLAGLVRRVRAALERLAR